MRTIKHYVESRIGKVVEFWSVLFTCLIPFCADILNTFSVGADGHIAFAMITSHACKVAQIGFAEVVDFKLELTRTTDTKQTASSMRECFWDMLGDRRNILLRVRVLYTNAGLCDAEPVRLHLMWR